MTKTEAEDRAATLNREHPDRGLYRWIARPGAEDWQVARVEIPGGKRLHPLHGTVEAKPQPSPSDDPRTAYDKNVGGPWVGGI
jgi:hypothetical protein